MVVLHGQCSEKVIVSMCMYDGHDLLRTVIPTLALLTVLELLVPSQT
jgi:hypothetical protein